MAQEEQPSGLFAIFLLTIYSLILIPYTFYWVCSTGEVKSEAVLKGKKKQPAWQKLAVRLLTKGNLVLLVLWVAWVLLLLYVKSSSGDMKTFDPFEILGLERSATEKEIKKAYRKLSLQFHPDKNPDPKAADYFASHISKAYKALTDDVSRMNYEKHGHPDGPQGINLGVALPSWMFNRDKKTAPLLLLGLVGGCILLPLAVVSYYMLKGDNYVGPNKVHNNTLMVLLSPKYGIKESQSLVRIPETLMLAWEWLLLYTPNDHQAPMDELRREVAPAYPDVMGRDKKAFYNRKGGVVKAHMLLLAHLERMESAVPLQLLADLKFVRQKCPVLLDEMVRVAALPRNNLGFGWMTPALACVEMMQCVAQAIPVNVRKGGSKGSDALAPLLALPHFDQEVVKRLRKMKVMAIKDLQEMKESQVVTALKLSGLSAVQAEEVSATLQAMPQLAVSVQFEVDGEEEICERDPVHCKVRVLLSRPSHSSEGFKLRGTAVRAFTPSNPEPQDEAWYAFLTDTANNHLVAFAKVNLFEAEKACLDNPRAFAALKGGAADGAVVPAASSNGKAGANGGAVVAANGTAGSKEEAAPGQVLDLVFQAPPTGRYDLTLTIMSSTWVGADLVTPAKLKVATLSRAAAEGRDPKTLDKKKFRSDSDSDDDRESAAGSSGSGSDSDDEDDDYDSEETGELESSDGEGGDGEGEEDEEELPPLVGEDGAQEEAGGAAAAKKNK